MIYMSDTKRNILLNFVKAYCMAVLTTIYRDGENLTYFYFRVE